MKKKINDFVNNDIGKINFTDFFESNRIPEKNYYTITNEGRIEYEDNGIYLPLNAYYQWEKSLEFKNIKAYYLQTKIKSTINKTTFRLGAEILNGKNAMLATDQLNTFGINYGVA